MKNYILFLGLLAFLFLGGLVISCKGDEEITVDTPLPMDNIPEEEGENETPEQSFQKSCATIIERITTENVSAIQNVNTLANVVDGHLDKMKEDGSFSDVNYEDKAYTSWPVVTHLDRVKQMALAYIIPGNAYCQQADLYEKIVKALEYWNDNRPMSNNWWYNEISVPRSMGLILVLLRSGKEKVPKEIENALLKYLQNSSKKPSEYEAANKVDVTLHWLYRGCLQQDKEVVDIAVSEAFSPLAYTTGEGIQYDNSYFQHSQQLYIGGYATVLVNRAVEIAIYASGTDYALTTERLSVLSEFVRGTLLRCIRKQYMFYNVMGRSIARFGALNQGTGMISLLNKLKQVDISHISEYEQAIMLLSGGEYNGMGKTLTHYYVGDFTLYQSADYSIGVRAVSNRTYRCENGNGENLKGYFLSDGSMVISREGNEYVDIFPVWDWGKVPGVTAPQISSIPVIKNWTQKGESDFVGGVSDGKIGASVYKMNNTKDGIRLSANKAWFFGDKEIVCLGSNITSVMNEEVTTALNQCLLSGTVAYSNGGNVSSISKGMEVTNATVDWVLHKNVGYFLPQKQVVSFKAENRKGSWKDINTAETHGTTYKDVCTIWLSHGSQPSKATYSYIIVPNMADATAMRNYDVSNMEILSNTENVQAVRDRTTGVVQIIFYKGATLNFDNTEVAVDSGCALILKDYKTVFDVYISDPSHNVKQLTLRIKRSGKEASETLNTLFSNDGNHKGKSHYISMSLK